MLKRFRKLISKLPPALKNPYLIGLGTFAVWMLFIDENNLFVQYRRHKELSSLLEKKKFYVQQISQTQSQLSELSSNPISQEKFAREHYWMKKDNEDVFVIVQPGKNNP
jgi:cell division protein DivIC